MIALPRFLEPGEDDDDDDDEDEDDEDEAGPSEA